MLSMPNLFYGRKKRKREEEPSEQIQEQPEIKREKLEESRVPSLFKITLPHLRHRVQKLLNEKESIRTLTEKIPVEVLAAIFNDRLFFGNTILHQIHDVDDIKFLLDNGADPNLTNDDGQTVLNYYLALRKTDAAQSLLENALMPLDLDTGDIFGSTPLINAIKTGDYKIFITIFNRLLKIEGFDMVKHLAQKNKSKQNAFLLIMANSPQWLSPLLPYYNFDTFTHLLIIAAKKDYPDAIKILLDYGYSVDVTDRHGWTALMYAVEAGNEAAVNELLNYKPKLEEIFFDPNNPEGQTTLARMAGKSGNINIISRLLQAGFPIDFGSEQDGTMLYNAIKHVHLELVQFLLARGANPNKGDHTESPLRIAILSDEEMDFASSPVTIDILIALLKDPRTNVQNQESNEESPLTQFINIFEETPLEKKVEVIKLFIERGSPISEQDLALTEDDPEIHKLLEEAKANQ